MSDLLDVLLADGVIDEVLGRLKSGKEANISLVRRGDAVVAAKVYKDRATRSFKNNADYKEGRKVRNTRTQRAMDQGGQFGRAAAEQEWKSAEADALYKLAGSGVRVPEPLMFYEGVLLMNLVRDAEGHPAPRLIDVAIERDAAIGIYADLVAQIISMLCCDLIHGDLSPYNILAAADGPTIIDFPQVISAAHSSRAEYFFLRDFDNVVSFLAGFDPSLAVHRADGRAIWRAYVSRELTPQFVPPPPPPPRDNRRWQADDRRRDDRRGPRPPGTRPSQPQRDQAQRPQQRFDAGARNSQPQRDQAQRPQPRFEGGAPQSARNSQPQQRQQPQQGFDRGPPHNARSSQPPQRQQPQQRFDGGPSASQRPQQPQRQQPQQRFDGGPSRNARASQQPQQDQPQQRPQQQPPQQRQQQSDARPPQFGARPSQQEAQRQKPASQGPRRRPKRRW